VGIGAAIGAIVGAVAGAGGLVLAGFTAGTMWMAGAAIGSLFDTKIGSFDAVRDTQSPTYSFGPISNTMSQLLPVPLVYGKNRLAGNVIMQRFLNDKKTKQYMFVGLGNGGPNGFQSITDVMVNDLKISEAPGCSCTIYYGTPNQAADWRTLGDKSYPNLAYLALTLKASDKLSGNPTITCIAEGRKVPTPTTIQYSRNPAWVIYDILTAKYYDPISGKNEPVGLGLPTELIDLPSFQEAAAYCDELVDGKPRFTIDYTIDTQKPAIDHLVDILSCFRGAIIARDKIKLYIDKPVTAPYKAIDENNILNGTFTWWQRRNEDRYNRVIVEWIDPENHWERVSSVFENVEDIEKRGVYEKSYQLLGITRPEQAARMGAYLIDISNGCRFSCQFGVSISDSDIEVGDVIALTHSLPGWNNKWMRVVNVIDHPDDTITVTCSEYVLEAYNDRAMDINLTVDTNLPNIYDVQPPANITVSEWGYRTKNKALITNLEVQWNAPMSGAEVGSYNVYRTIYGVRELVGNTIETKMGIDNVPVQTPILIEVESVSRLGVRSNTVSTTYVAIGIDDLPPPVEDFTVRQFGRNLVFYGKIPNMPDFNCVELRVGGTSWATSKVVTRASGFPFQIPAFFDGTYIFRVKTVDNAEQFSSTEAVYSLNITGINKQLNIILERDDIALRTGTLTNLVRLDNGFLVPAGNPPYKVLSPVIDTLKLGLTGINFDFITTSNFKGTEIAYKDVPNRLYGISLSDKYGMINFGGIPGDIKVKFSDDNTTWTDWEHYTTSGERMFRYIRYEYSIEDIDFIVPTPERTTEDVQSRITESGVERKVESLIAYDDVFYITQLKQVYDVPDIEIVDTISVPIDGVTINFKNDYNEEFYFAPREITPIILQNDGTVYPYVSDITNNGFNIICYDSEGNSVAKDVQITVRGY